MFVINVDVIDRCNCRSDICTFTCTKVLPEEQKGFKKNSRTTMEKWKAMLRSGNSEISEAEIKPGIFQDSLSPLVIVFKLIPLSLILRKSKAAYESSESKEKINYTLFMDDLKLYSWSEKGLESLVQTVCVFSEDIGMEFGIEKYAMLVMEKGKIVKSVGI